MKSIRKKLVLLFASICTICVLAALGISSYVSYNSLEKTQRQRYQNEAAKNVSDINSWLTKNAQIVDTVQTSLESIPDFSVTQISGYLTQATKKYSDALDIYFGYSDKTFIDGSGWTPTADYDCTARGWYTSAVEKDGIFIGAPSLDLSTNTMVVTISAPVKQNNKLVGVVSMDVGLKTVVDSINKLNENKDGVYSFLVDNDDKIIMHPNKAYLPTEKSATNIKEILSGVYADSKASSSDQQPFIKDYDGKQKLLIVSTVPSTNWKVGIVIPDDIFKKELSGLITIMIFIIFATLAIVITAAIIASNKITKPIITLTEIINRTKDFELKDKETEPYKKILKDKTEIGKIAGSIHELRQNLLHITLQLKKTAGSVSKQSEQVKTSLDENIDAIKRVTSTLGEISTAIDSEANDSQDGIEKLSELSNEITTASDAVDGLNVLSQNTTSDSMIGIEQINILAKKISDNGVAQQKVVDNVSSLAEKSKSIGTISDTKSNIDVVEETNSECVDSMKEAHQAFKKINSSVEDMSNSIRTLTSAVNEVNSNKDKVVMTFSDISSATEEISASAQEILTSVDYQKESTIVIGDLVHSLEEVVVEMDQVLSQLHTD